MGEAQSPVPVHQKKRKAAVMGAQGALIRCPHWKGQIKEAQTWDFLEKQNKGEDGEARHRLPHYYLSSGSVRTFRGIIMAFSSPPPYFREQCLVHPLGMILSWEICSVRLAVAWGTI